MMQNENHQTHVFLKPLKAQTMWKTLEMIIAERMQNMGANRKQKHNFRGQNTF